MGDSLHRRHGIVLPLVLGGLLVLSLGWTACRTAEEPEDNASEQQIEENLEEAGEQIGDGLESLGEAAQQSAEKVQEEVGPEVERLATDAAITARIKTKLTSDPELNPIRIDVDTVNGQVTLTGTVPSEAEKQEAGDLARSTKGVKSVENLLQVVGD